tara:strand:+ start:290 stop:673 length:384 start_codon:yes stop_codon:yes gene_type:complete
MPIKSSQTLISEALKEIKTISPAEALKLSNENKCNLIDIRDAIELQREGRIENSFHISRGLLEFAVHPDSPYAQKEKLDPNKELVLFCAAGGRSALAAKTLKEMGFEKVSHIEGGFTAMKNSGFETS